MLIFMIRSEHHHLGTRADLFQAPRGFHAVHIRHDQIHQDHIRHVLRANVTASAPVPASATTMRSG
jgi:hypothetical protein